MKAIHDKVKDYKCEECNFATSYSFNLKIHKTHVQGNGSQAKKVKSFKCDDCGYSASAGHYIARHKKAVHDKIKDYKCDRCEYVSSHSHSLKQHMKQQHQERRKLNSTPPIIRSNKT